MKPHPSGMMMGGLSTFSVTGTSATAGASGAWDGNPKATSSITVSQLTGPPSGLTATWALVSGSGITAASPSPLTTTFSGNPPDENTTVSGTMRCTVTNGFGQTATWDVAVSISAGLAGIAVGLSPSNVTTSHSNGSNFTQVFTTSPSCPKSAGPFTVTWNAGGGAVSPGTGASSTLTVSPGGVGNTTLATVGATVTDGAGRTGAANANCNVTWT